MTDSDKGPDPYRKIHKSLRRDLYLLALQAGALDHEAPREIEAMAASVQAVIERLRLHARGEDEFIHPLIERRLPHANQWLSRHRELELREREIEIACAALLARPTAESAHGLYRAIDAFLAACLPHMGEEEALLPALRRACGEARPRPAGGVKNYTPFETGWGNRGRAAVDG